jgi:DNA-binding MarR family transcriptional regulator
MATLVQRTWKALQEAPSPAEGVSTLRFMKPPSILVLIAVAQVSDVKHHGIAGGVTSQDVADHVGMARSTAGNHLERLTAWGWLNRRGLGKYVYSLNMRKLSRDGVL